MNKKKIKISLKAQKQCKKESNLNVRNKNDLEANCLQLCANDFFQLQVFHSNIQYKSGIYENQIELLEQYKVINECICNICYETIKIGQMVKKMPCQHYYHKYCIEKWLKLMARCPLCNYNLNKQ